MTSSYLACLAYLAYLAYCLYSIGSLQRTPHSSLLYSAVCCQLYFVCCICLLYLSVVFVCSPHTVCPSVPLCQALTTSTIPTPSPPSTNRRSRASTPQQTLRTVWNRETEKQWQQPTVLSAHRHGRGICDSWNHYPEPL